jgi:PBSX family phage portal protein
MKKRQTVKATASTPAPATATQTTTSAAPMAFSFGEPMPVMDRRDLFDYLECAPIGNWYTPPLSWEGLARTFRAAAHHGSSIYVKRNILLSTFEPTPRFSRLEFSRFALDYLTFGNAYIERQSAVSGKVLAYKTSPAKWTRRGTDLDTYWFIQIGKQDYAFQTGNVFHLMEPDINQEVYGLPEYLSALNSVWLNESATLFRRKYYLNGSHAGFIFYMTDPAQKQEDIDNLREAFRQAKGPGNFKNLFLYAPGGKKDGVQLIPVSEVAARDDFLNIKNVTRDDQLAAHRVPPQLMEIIPHNTGGFGDAEKAAAVFAVNEVSPLQARMLEVNDWAGEEVIRFKPYAIAAGE